MECTHEELMDLSPVSCRGANLWVNSKVQNTYNWARDRIRQIATHDQPELFAYLEWMIGKVVCGVPNRDKLCFVLWGEHDNLKSALGRMFEVAFPFYSGNVRPDRLFGSKSGHDRSIDDLYRRPVRLLFLDEASSIGDGKFIKQMCSPGLLQLEIPRNREKTPVANQATVMLTANVDKGLETIRKTAASDSGLASKLRFVECPAQIVDDESLVDNLSVFQRNGDISEWLNNAAVRNGIRRYFVELGLRYAHNTREPECVLVKTVSTSAGSDRTWSDLSQSEKEELVRMVFQAMPRFKFYPGDSVWSREVFREWNDQLLGATDSTLQRLRAALHENPLPFVGTAEFVKCFNETYKSLLYVGPILGQSTPIVLVNEKLSASRRPTEGSVVYPLRFILSDAKVSDILLPFSMQIEVGKGEFFGFFSIIYILS